MAGKRRSSVKGAGRLRRTLRSLPSEITAEVGEAIAQVAEAMLADMKAAVPVRTGNLKEKLRVAVAKNGLSARIGTFGGKGQRAAHAHLVEFGTASGPRKSPSGATVNHPGTKAQPYMLPAYRKHRKDGFATIKRATIKVLDAASKGGGSL